MDRSELNQVKLMALVRDHFGTGVTAEPTPFRDGAALFDGDFAYVLTDKDLAGAVAWGLKQNALEIHVFADHGGGAMARAAEAFDLRLSVWQIEGRKLIEAIADPDLPADPPDLSWLDRIREAGADAVVEDGRIIAEFLGLEIGVVEDGRLRVGVNESDRQAHEELHGLDMPMSVLTGVVDQVREVRRPGSDHPFCLRDRDRWLRSAVVADPALAGISTALSPGSARATAVGEDVAVACSAGVDLDVVVRLVRAAGDAGTRVVAVPDGDNIPALEGLAAALTNPAEVRPITAVPWSA